MHPVDEAAQQPLVAARRRYREIGQGCAEDIPACDVLKLYQRLTLRLALRSRFATSKSADRVSRKTPDWHLCRSGLPEVPDWNLRESAL